MKEDKLRGNKKDLVSVQLKWLLILFKFLCCGRHWTADNLDNLKVLTLPLAHWLAIAALVRLRTPLACSQTRLQHEFQVFRNLLSEVYTGMDDVVSPCFSRYSASISRPGTGRPKLAACPL